MSLASNLERLRRGTFLVFLGQGFVGVAGLLISMILTRTTSPEDLGRFYTLQQGVVAMGILISRMGMDVGIQRLIGSSLVGGSLAPAFAYARNALFMVLVASLVVGGSMWLLWRPMVVGVFSDEALLPFWAQTALLVTLGATVNVAGSVLLGLGQVSRGVLWLGVPRQLGLVTAVALLWWWGSPLPLVTVVNLVAASFVLSAFLAMAVLGSHFRGLDPTPWIDNRICREIIVLCLPMMLQGGALVIMSSADIWVLAALRTPAEVGVYGAVTKLSTAMAFALTVVNTVLPAMVARLHAEGKIEEMETLLRHSATWGTLMAVPMTVILTLSGPFCLRLVFGPDFVVGAGALAVLAVAQCINAMAGSPGYALQMTGGHKTLTVLTLITAVLNLLGNLLLVPEFGLMGAAVATGAALVLQNLVMVVLVRRRLGVWTFTNLRV